MSKIITGGWKQEEIKNASELFLNYKMADLNEETTPEINEVEETVEEKRKPIDPSIQGIQLFYEKNKQ